MHIVGNRYLWILTVIIIMQFAIAHRGNCADESIIFTAKDNVYVASFADNAFSAQKAIADELRPYSISASNNGKCVVIADKVQADAPSGWIQVDSGQFRLLSRADHGIAAIPFSSSLSPNGERLAYVRTTDHGTQLCTMTPSTGESTCIKDNCHATGLAWSPDGSKLAYFSESHGGLALHIYNMATGQDEQIDGPQLPIHYDGDWRNSVVWSPDGTRLYYEKRDEADSPGQYGTYEADVSKPASLKRISDGFCSSISSDGKTLYITDRGDIYALDISTAECVKTLIVKGGHDAKISPSGKWLAYIGADKSLRCRDITAKQDYQISNKLRMDNDVKGFGDFQWIMSKAGNE